MPILEAAHRKLKAFEHVEDRLKQASEFMLCRANDLLVPPRDEISPCGGRSEIASLISRYA